jgi:hypothetical protein
LKSRERRDIIDDPGYTLSSIRGKIPAADLQFLSIFDLYLTRKYTIESKDISIASLHPELPPYNNVSDLQVTVNGPQKPVVVKQSSTAYTLNDLESHRNKVLGRLNDSVSVRFT